MPAPRQQKAARSRWLRDGDPILIDCERRTIDLMVDESELISRRTAWRPARRERLAGVMEKYARLVGPAHLGAVTHGGAVDWPRG